MNSPDFEHDSIKPRYDSYCFSNIPSFIHHALNEGHPSRLTPEMMGMPERSYRNVAFVFADAFGWNHFQRFADHPFLRRLTAEGYVRQGTSQFPSTTAAHITTVATAQVVGEHGVFEWQYYEPRLDAMFQPLVYSYSGDPDPETLRKTDADPRELLPCQHTFYQALEMDGIASFTLVPTLLTLSTYSNVMGVGNTMIPCQTLTDALQVLTDRLAGTTTPAYYSIYYPEIDSKSHEFGPDSPQAEAEIIHFLDLMNETFFGNGRVELHDTLLLLTADHGQTAVSPKTTVYLNQLPEFEQLRPLMRTNGAGKLLTPGGSARDVFLYIEDAHLEEARALLADVLDDTADVYLASDLIELGLFGTARPSQTFLDRVSNLVILPRANQTVWWYEKDRFDQKFFGHHGGLSPDEMELPILTYIFD